jgi:rRNA-processing protein FCF1
MIIHEIRESGLKQLSPTCYRDLIKICKKHKVTLSEAIDAIAQQDVELLCYGGEKDPNVVLKEIKEKIDELIQSVKEKDKLLLEIQSVEVENEGIRYGIFRLVNSIIFNPSAECVKEYLTKHDMDVHKNKADQKIEADLTGI